MKQIAAMVFAAGLGTRLRPLTDHCPKALIEVGGVPMLQRVLLSLKNAGIRRAVVNVHHLPDMIESFLSANSNFGMEIAVSDERSLLLDTGGGMAKAIPLFGDADAILMHNADIFTDIPLATLINAHCSDVTLAAWSRESSRVLLFDSDNRMHGWKNLSTGQIRPDGLAAGNLRPLAFGGIHIMNREILSRLSDYRPGGTPFSITDFYIDSCGDTDIRAFSPSAPFTWHDIGRIATLQAL